MTFLKIVNDVYNEKNAQTGLDYVVQVEPRPPGTFYQRNP